MRMRKTRKSRRFVATLRGCTFICTFALSLSIIFGAFGFVPVQRAYAISCEFGTDIGGGQCRGYITVPASGQRVYWVVPADWSSTNTVECIGAGGYGYYGTDGAGGNGAGGGGGGAYAKSVGLPLPPGSKIIAQIGDANGSSRSTWFNGTSTSTTAPTSGYACAAEGGQNNGGLTSGASGGLASNSYATGVGSVKYSGGNGGDGESGAGDKAGGGGGGAAGSSGNGFNGSGTSGGAGDLNFGGATSTVGNAGNAGTEYDGTHGSGSGGGGGSAGANAGGVGGSYGGGGGGGGKSDASYGSLTYGADGLIVITYTPSAVVNPHLRVDSWQSDGTFTVPAGVTGVLFEGWGGGGGGSANAGGGGGGAHMYYSTTTTPGDTFTITVGAGGGSAASGGTTTVVKSGTTFLSAQGGRGGGSQGGLGGRVASSTGEAGFGGGNGAQGTGTQGGGAGAGDRETDSFPDGTSGGCSVAYAFGGKNFGGTSCFNAKNGLYGAGGQSYAGSVDSGTQGIARATYYYEVPAGFPVVKSRSWGRSRWSDSGTTHVVDMPPGVQAGELLLVFFTVTSPSSISTVTVTPSAGWTILDNTTYNSSIRTTVLYKTAAGDDTLTITTGASSPSEYFSYRIEGATGVPTAASSTGSVAAPQVTAGTNGKNLYISLLARRAELTPNALRYISAAPSYYDDYLYMSPLYTSSVGGLTLYGMDAAVADRHKVARSESPGSFTVVQDQTNMIALSIAIPGTTTPEVFNHNASSVGTSSAVLKAQVATLAGASSVTDRGFATSTNSTLSSSVATSTESGSFSTGAFYATSSNLTANTTYYFRSFASTSAGISYSTTTSFLTLPGPPGSVSISNVAATSATATWSAPSPGGAPTYRLTYCIDGSSTCTVATGISGTSTTTNPTLVGNTTYGFAVRATNATGDSYSTATTTQLLYPGVPGTPTFTNIATTSLTISWSGSVGSSTSYKVERCTGGACSNFAEIATGIGTTTYNDSNLSGFTSYIYRVRGTNAAGDGLYSTAGVTTVGLPTVTLSGTLYSGEGSGAIPSKTIKASIAGATPLSSDPTDGGGLWSISTDSVATGTPIAFWVDGDASTRAFVLDKASTTGNNISGIDLYQNRVIVRHEATSGTSTNIADLSFADSAFDPDIQLTASGGSLRTHAGQKLYIWPNTTFSPGGQVRTNGNASTSPDGDFQISTGATFVSGGDVFLAGNLILASGATFTSGSNNVTFTATTSGKTISGAFVGSNAFASTTFNGIGGGWTFSSNASSTGDFVIQNGSTTAPSLLTVGGNFTNNSSFIPGSGTTTLSGSALQTVSGTSSFSNLVISNTSGLGGSNVSVSFAATTTVSNNFFMLASTSAKFLAGALHTLQNISLQGASTRYVWLRSSTEGSQWRLYVPGVRSITYVHVKDSYACSAAPDIATPGNSVDATGNSCWNFGGLASLDTGGEEVGGSGGGGAGIVTGGGNDGGDPIGEQSGGGASIGNEAGFVAPLSFGVATLWGAGWTNGGNAFGQDGAYATADSLVASDYYDFGFNIPGTNVITGIAIKLLSKASTAAGAIGAELSWDSGVSTTTSASLTPTLSTSDTVYTLGGQSSLFGRSWIPGEFSNANFRVRLIGVPGGNTLSLDALQVSVFHQAQGGSGGGGGGEI